MELTEECIQVAIKDSFIKEMLDSTRKFNKVNLIRVRELRRFTGQANRISGLLFTWRPFLDTQWASLSLKGKRKGRATHEFVWERQIQPSLEWFLCFRCCERTNIARRWWYTSYRF